MQRTALLTIAGLGPGGADHISPAVYEALRTADCVAGYTVYMELIPPPWLEGKERIATAMNDEIGRCRAAVRAALAGKATVLVCSGDPGVYALAGLVHELVEAWGVADTLSLTVLPGIPAVCAAAALLGAPLTHDFACVSLSDLLTPWERIERRAQAALVADFVLALYNPRSKKRHWQLGAVIRHALAERGPQGVVGVVRMAYRPEQSVWVGALHELDPECVDMFSLVVIGNSMTRQLHGRMVTPRGYLDAYAAGSI